MESLQGSILSLIRNVLINILDNGTDGLFIKFAGSTKLGGATSGRENGTRLQPNWTRWKTRLRGAGHPLRGKSAYYI